MKYISLLFVLLVFQGCMPERPRVEVDLTVRRFEQDLFSLDTDNLKDEVAALQESYPFFFQLYIEGILRLGSLDDTMEAYLPKLEQFLKDEYMIGLYDTCMERYANMDDIEKGLEEAIGYLKHHVPEQPVPDVLTFITPFSSAALTYDTLILALGLDMHLGEKYIYYPSLNFPQYMIRKFKREYMVRNGMNVVITGMFEQKDADLLIDKMVYNGKILFFLDQVMPDSPDSIIMGYTQEQLEWCDDNEREIWTFFISKDLLFSSSSLDHGKYVNDGPSTPGMPDGSPGNVGSWVGWQIVKQYMEKNEKISLKALMEENDGQKILSGSRYKPKRFSL